MNKTTLFIASAIILTMVVVGPAFADTTADLLAKISTLEKKISDKDAIIMEQVKVIMNIKDNYKVKYPTFDKVKYASTDGFPTEWLQGEHDKILQTCNDAKAMGYENPYCKFVK